MWRARHAVAGFGLAVAMASAAVASTQSFLDNLLSDTSADRIAVMRSSCALGRGPNLRKRLTDADVEAPPTGAWCVTVLIRTGRDGALGYVRDPSTNALTPSLAFDSGFVGAYLKRGALPAGAPSMAALLPVAERCLGQQEPNTKLCSSAGYMIGLRAARGETVDLN